MKFSKLARYFERLEKTASRLEMTRILAELFKEASDAEIAKICYLSLGRLTPLYESLEFQLAEKMVARAIATAFSKEKQAVLLDFRQKGDLGVVAEALARNSKFPFDKAQGKQITNSKLTILDVYQKLRAIAEDKGEKSQERKVAGLVELLQRLDSLGVRYLTRMVVGKLRLGFSDKTIIDALSWMKVGDKSWRDELEKAYFVRADIGVLAEVFKKQGRKGLQEFSPELGVPVMPTLCQRLKTAKEMLEKMGTVVVEPKFDGTRVQIHLRKVQSSKFKVQSDQWRVRTFTRNMEESTWMFPELKQAHKQIAAQNVILDSEAVGVEPKTGKFLSFQDTMVRKRKHGIEEMSQKVPLRFFVFDVLYIDGKSLLAEPLTKRREILEKLLKPDKAGPLSLTEQIRVDKPEELVRYHDQQLKKGLEGAVVKKADSAYVPGRRAWNWVKFKEVETARGGLADTLDCVVMGYYGGRGKRASFGIGAFLVGVLADKSTKSTRSTKGTTGSFEEGKIYTIAKIGTGLSDEQWKEMKKRADKEKVKEQPKEYVVDKSLVPDVWIEPSIVVEIAADNLTRSPNHSAKLALRFPRLVRFRDDKRVDQATGVKEVEEMAS